MPDLSIEQTFKGIIAGVDEAGRGPWAGPVVAAAVILGENIPDGINDSKKLSKSKREALYPIIMQNAMVGIGLASSGEIDELNILRASMLAMERAIASLPVKPDFALIDGNKIPNIDIKCQAVVKGDSKSLSIAAASIIAKVERDRIMDALHDEFPYYNWIKNSGYGTKDHQNGIKSHGITEHHRKSFRPVKEAIGV